MSNQPRRVEQIVRAALELDPEDREAFLDDTCAEDANLRRSVETWLRIRTNSSAPVTLPPTPVESSAPRADRPPPPRPTPRKGGLLTVLLAILLLVALGLAGYFAIQAQREAAIANDLRAQAESRLSLLAEPPVRLPDTASRAALEFVVRDLLASDSRLDGQIDRLKEIAGSDENLKATLDEALGTAYLTRGDGKNALPHLEAALPKRDSPTLQARINAARQITARTALPQLRARIDELQKQEKYTDAEPLLREVVVLLRATASEPLDRAIQEVLLGRNLLAQEKYAVAEPFLRAALAEIEKQRPGQWPFFDTQSLLGASLLGQKRYTDAEPLLLAGYEGLKQRQEQVPDAVKSRINEAGLRIVALYDASEKKEQADAWRRKLGM